MRDLRVYNALLSNENIEIFIILQGIVNRVFNNFLIYIELHCELSLKTFKYA